MTTPRPTADPAGSDLAALLPDEATLNRLAGEFFAALPGAVPAASAGAPGVPAMPAVADPAVGPAPSRSVPDVTEVADSAASAERFAGDGQLPASPLPLVVPDPASESAAIPVLPGLAAPLPTAGLPGVAASDQVLTSGGLPSGAPDAATFANAPSPVGAVPGVAGASAGATGREPPEDPAVTGAFPAPGPVPRTGPFDARVPDLPSGSVVPDVSGVTEPAQGLAPATPQPPVALPDAPVPVPTPSTPYYFLAESSPYRGDDAALAQLADLAVPEGSPTATVEPRPAGASTPAHDGNIYVQRDLDTGGQAGTARPEFYFSERPAGPVPAGSTAPRADHGAFDVHRVRRDFPILRERVNGRPLIWFDNAATTQKPQAVIDRLAHFYSHENSNIHRAAHELAARATDAYEGARKTVARFLGAPSEKDIVFVRGATEAINLVAKSWGAANITAGDEIVVSHLEHHANIVPWQQLIDATGARLRVIPVDDSGQLIMSEYAKLLGERTKLVAVTHVSNALGTVTPIYDVVEAAHRAGACVLVDGAQSTPHLRINLQAMDPDFFVFSGHKVFAPTGIGVLYGRRSVLESMPPWEGGGNMITDVTFERTSYQHPPARFEAGTGNIADAAGLATALDYVTRLGIENLSAYEHLLLEYATPRMRDVPGLRMVGTARDKASVLSFVLDGYRPEEVGSALNQEGIAVRSGHHCAQPILRRFGLEATVRPSLAFYNTTEEVDVMVAALHRLAANRGRR